MKRGRKPIPTQLKLVRGNPGNRPLNENEPQPSRAKMTTCPAHLSTDAKREWKRIAPELYRLGLLTIADRPALAAYCQAYGRWVEAEREAEKLGLIVKTKKGALIQNPYLAVANRAMEQMRQFLVEFGMTPSSRTRVSASSPAGKDAADKKRARFFGGGAA